MFFNKMEVFEESWLDTEIARHTGSPAACLLAFPSEQGIARGSV